MEDQISNRKINPNTKIKIICPLCDICMLKINFKRHQKSCRKESMKNKI